MLSTWGTIFFALEKLNGSILPEGLHRQFYFSVKTIVLTHVAINNPFRHCKRHATYRVAIWEIAGGRGRQSFLWGGQLLILLCIWEVTDMLFSRMFFKLSKVVMISVKMLQNQANINDNYLYMCLKVLIFFSSNLTNYLVFVKFKNKNKDLHVMADISWNTKFIKGTITLYSLS